MSGKQKEGYLKAYRRKMRDNPVNVLKNSVYQARLRSKTKGMAFDIDLEYILGMAEEQGWKCCVTGQTFDSTSTKFRVNPNTPSIDKIVPELGYVRGNVRLVTWQVNCAISEYGLESFLAMCCNAHNFNR